MGRWGIQRAKTGNKGGSSSNPVPRDEEEEEIELEDVEAPHWETKLPLSSVQPKKFQVQYFKEKLTKKNPFLCERDCFSELFETYGMYESFEKWGWMAALQPVQYLLISARAKDSEKRREIVYVEAVRDWLSTLERTFVTRNKPEFRLTGTVNGKKITLSLDSFDEVAKKQGHFDSGISDGDEYVYPSSVAFLGIKPGHPDWLPMVEELFLLPADKTWDTYKFYRRDLNPRAQVIFRMIIFNILPRESDVERVYCREMPLLHALYTGSPVYSLRHVMMIYLWNCREAKDRGTMPFTRFLSAFLKHAKALGNEEPVTRVRVQTYHKVSSSSKLVFRNVAGRYSIECLRTGLIDTYNPDGVEADMEMEDADDDEDSDYAEEEEDAEEHQVAQQQEQPMQQSTNYLEVIRQIEQQRAEHKAAVRAAYTTHELYRQEDKEYFDGVRAWHLHRHEYPQGTPDAPPSPRYPYHPGSIYFQPPQPAQPIYREPRAMNAWNADELTTSLVAGIFGPPPTHPPQ